MHIETFQSAVKLFTADAVGREESVNIRFEGSTVVVPAGISVAAALLLSGAGHFRTTPISSTVRAPYCMMGVCFECLVEIDGHPSRQSCLTTVRDGMEIRRQSGSSDISFSRKELNHGD
jgi:predicted molibdopterin-dependent oxidoreductase YjgC